MAKDTQKTEFLERGQGSVMQREEGLMAGVIPSSGVIWNRYKHVCLRPGWATRNTAYMLSATQKPIAVCSGTEL